MNGKKILGAVLLAGLFVGAAGAASAADLWIHIKVDGGRHAEQVEINLPLSMVESFAPMLKGELSGDGNRVKLRDRDYDLEDLRRVWPQLEKGPDATYLTVNEPGSKVRIAKRGGYLVLTAVDLEGHGAGDGAGNGETAEIRVPVTVMAALLSGPGDELDVSAALRELVRYGEGDLLTVQSDEETVRIWVDGEAGR